MKIAIRGHPHQLTPDRGGWKILSARGASGKNVSWQNVKKKKIKCEKKTSYKSKQIKALNEKPDVFKE